MADDGVDIFRLSDAARGGDDMAEQGLAADLVKDLGAAGLEAGSLAGCHDDDGEG